METLNRRVPFVLIILGVLSSLLVGQLISFQFRLNPSITEFEAIAGQRLLTTSRISANRGQIYDRDGVVLAVNSFEYRVGISPALITSDRREAAIQLAALLDLNEADIYENLQPDINGYYQQYVLLKGPVDDATASAVEELDVNGIIIEPVALRTYPQGALTSQIVGFVNYSEQGYYGIEGKYDLVLAGSAREVTTVDSPFNVDEIPDARDGQSLVLTIDRDIQNIVQQVLEDAVLQNGALGGTIIVMNPRTGEILGMQSTPIFPSGEVPLDPDTGEPIPYNPGVSSILEPGSIIKVVTAAIALQANIPGLDLNWTYNDPGCFTEAGVNICTWDRAARGNTTFTNCIVLSLNTCTATWNKIVGPAHYYDKIQEFGFGQPTGIDLEGEAAGILNLPGLSPNWSEANFLNVSYGQGISVTALQMLNAVNAIANDGLMMQPHIVKTRIDGNVRHEVTPNPISRPISQEVADAVTQIMIQTVNGETLDAVANIPGYSVAGKTGTAQKVIPGGYSDTDSWASFVGFLPADDPIISAIIILDRPEDYWGSLTAAPVFRTLMEQLVLLLEIPPDDIRHNLEALGGEPFARR